MYQLSVLKLFVTVLFFYFFLTFVPDTFAATIYTDGDLASDCTSNNYSITNRDCTGSDGNAYQTIADARDTIVAGDTLYIRQGTYVENAQTISQLGSFASMTTIAGYPNETITWQNNTIYFETIRLHSNANNITIQNINFEGLRYVASDTRTWELYDTNTWRTTVGTQPPAEVVEVKSGCDTGTLDCTKSVSLSNEEADIAGVTAGTDGDWYQNYSSDNRLYVHSSTDPGTRDDIWETGRGVTIGNDSSSTGYIVVANNTFDGNGHVHLKGGYRWHAYGNTFEQIGTDFNDHHIYAFGIQSLGSEAIYERNFFINDDAMGAAFHIYNGGGPGAGPAYHVMRYNIVRGAGFWAFLLYGENLTATNNTMSIENGRQAFGFEPDHIDNTITNNIIIGPAQLAAFTFEGGAGNQHFIRNNITYNITTSHGSCPLCTFENNQFGTDPELINNTPSSISDFRIQSTSPARDAGENIGTGYDIGFNNEDTSWPLGTLDQDEQGSEWDIGAFIYYDPVPGTSGSSGSSESSQNQSSSSADSNLSSCTTFTPPSAPDLYQINATGNNALLKFVPLTSHVTSYDIMYGFDDNIDRFSVNVPYGTATGSIAYTINHLSPQTGYFFKIRAKNDCQPGPWSNTIQIKTDAEKRQGGLVYFAMYPMKRVLNLLGW